ncbi:hypothetical protein [Roseovarius sp. D22-M7]|uniref:hypothetical protein n=1 Tax=Roseovarius sp. D22-M7 TaxID=3127116 RepID=UPI0030105E0E
MIALRWFQHAVGSSIGTVMVYVFSGLLCALVVTSVAEEIPELAELIHEVRCIIGFPAEGARCISDEIDSLRDLQEETAHKNRELEERLQAQETREEELAALSTKVENFSLFESETLDFGVVTTGVRFGTVLRPEEWSHAWCYTDRTVRGLARRIAVGEQDAGKPIVWHRVSDAELQDADLTRAQLEQAQTACHFPKTP